MLSNPTILMSTNKIKIKSANIIIFLNITLIQLLKYIKYIYEIHKAFQHSRLSSDLGKKYNLNGTNFLILNRYNKNDFVF